MPTRAGKPRPYTAHTSPEPKVAEGNGRNPPPQGNALGQNTHTMEHTINIQDILNTIPNCNFSKEAQIELLQIVRYITLVNQQPENICEILEQKIQLLQHPDNTQQPADAGADAVIERSRNDSADTACVKACPEQSEGSIPCVKVKAVAILELLNTLNAGTAHNDRTKICKLIAFLTGNSYHRIYNEFQKGILFSDFHTQQINEINKIFAELNIEITINPTKEY